MGSRPAGLRAFLDRVRPIGARVAIGVVAVEATVWILSWWPESPVAGIWPLLVFSGFALVFPLHLLTILTLGLGNRSVPADAPLRRRRNPFGSLTGWRRVAPTVCIGIMFLSVLTNPSSGQPARRDGRYYIDTHGVEEEVGRDEWLDAQAGNMRAFAGASLAFAGIAAATLTQRPTADADDR